MASRRRLFTDQQLIELHEQGLSDREIGNKLGAHETTVRDHIRRLGLKAYGHVRARKILLVECLFIQHVSERAVIEVSE